MEDKPSFEHYKFIADKGQNPLRVDKYLLNFIEFASRSKIQESIKSGNVCVNDKVVKANYKVKANDVVTIVYDFPQEKYELIPLFFALKQKSTSSIYILKEESNPSSFLKISE